MLTVDSLYKMMLRKPISCALTRSRVVADACRLADMESVDAEIYRSLIWTLENDVRHSPTSCTR